jgi:hypothetical protein
MGAWGFEPQSDGIFLEAKASTDRDVTSSPQNSAAHRSKTGADHSSQVILCPRHTSTNPQALYKDFEKETLSPNLTELAQPQGNSTI